MSALTLTLLLVITALIVASIGLMRLYHNFEFSVRYQAWGLVVSVALMFALVFSMLAFAFSRWPAQ